jgi:hypothetical protein
MGKKYSGALRDKTNNLGRRWVAGLALLGRPEARRQDRTTHAWARA